MDSLPLAQRIQRLLGTLAGLTYVEPPGRTAVVQLPYASWRDLQQVLTALTATPLVDAPEARQAVAQAHALLMTYQPPDPSDDEDTKAWRLALIDGWIRTHKSDGKVPWKLCELAGLHLLRALLEAPA